jgi:flagellar biosynthesis protein
MADNDPKKEAVALKYDRERDPAPRVVAKGRGVIAEQILKVAEEHGITIREDAELVEILGKLELDTIIPLEAYAAVASILSYVYSANDRMKRKTA